MSADASSGVGAQISQLVCRACGYRVPADEPHPFRCPRADGDDLDHVLRRRLDATRIEEPETVFEARDRQPFLRFRRLLHAYRAARLAGLSDADWVELVDSLDAAVAMVDEGGFDETPLLRSPQLAASLGVSEFWVKDESGNVSGSHKARHLMGVMLWLEAARRLELIPGGAQPPLAIASCGNAALAAAVVARAARRRLEVFVPPHANPRVLERLASLGAHLHSCPRVEGEPGDPCYLRFREALATGALPFTCQGNENGLTIDGGKTLVWEMVAGLRHEGAAVDRLFLHVGGGALATAVIEGLREARDLGLIDRLPIVHAVQTYGAHPLERAYGLLADRILAGRQAESAVAAAGHAARAAALAAVPRDEVKAALDHAATHRSEFMWPWQEEPHSIADGILDDETYDWLAVVEGMLETGGWPVLASEETLEKANRSAREALAVTPCFTGTAGLAGALTLAEEGILEEAEHVAVIISGVERS